MIHGNKLKGLKLLHTNINASFSTYWHVLQNVSMCLCEFSEGTKYTKAEKDYFFPIINECSVFRPCVCFETKEIHTNTFPSHKQGKNTKLN